MVTHARAGFSVIELLVAVAIFTVLAAALAHTLIHAQQVRASSARWWRAGQLAEERLERLRAGDRAVDTGPIGEFTRTWQIQSSGDQPGLDRVDVAVTWTDNTGPQRCALSALVRSSR
jgi:prepilin-type N-terminal cleavage/methylation domain-containing protein